MTRAVIPVAGLVVILLTAAPVLAQRSAEVEVGFNPQKLYDFSDVDSINTYNGNLTVVVPVGFRYSVSSTLSYQMNLVFNGKVWELESYDCQDTSGGRCERLLPSLRSNAGLGWRFSLGRLLPPYHPSNHSSLQRFEWVYESATGDEHGFGDWSGLSLRMALINSTTRDVQFPTGEVHRFVLENQEWRLKQMSDLYGNWVKVAYQYAPSPNERRATKWTITDSTERTHTVNFAYYPVMAETIDRGMQVTSITVDGYEGDDLTYTPTYTSTPTTYGCGRQSAVSAPRLTELTRPDGTKYSFQYDAVNSCFEGTLQKMTLATRGTIEYTYGQFTAGNPESPCTFGQPTLGTPSVYTRTVSDMNGSSRQWEYYRRSGPVVPWEGDEPCWPYDDFDYYVGRYWTRTSIVAPLENNKRNRTDHYFNIYSEFPNWPDGRLAALPGKEGVHYGYPGVIAVPPPEAAAKLDVPIFPPPVDISALDDATDPAPRYLTTQTYEGCDSAGDCTNGTLVQTTYTRYETNYRYRPQLESTRTVWNGDTTCGGSACFTQVTHSEPNGTGLFRKSTLTSNYSGTSAVVSETATDYLVWSDDDIRDPNKKWLLGMFPERRHTAASVTATTKYDFDPDTGFLRATRAMSGAALAADDVLTVFKRTSFGTHGEIHQVKRYGGYNGRLSTVSPFVEPSSDLDYVVANTLLNGVLTHSEYLRPSYAAEDFCTDASHTTCDSVRTTTDRDVDATSSLVTTARDSSGIATIYDYHSDGRLESVTPTGAASVHYTYTNATATANAKVSEVMKDTTAAQSVLRQATYEFDGLGRLKRVSNSLPDGNLAVVQTHYDAYGRRQQVSQPVTKTSHPTTNVGTYWTYFDYDAFGRQTRVVGPDSSVTQFAYTGARKVERTVQGIATSASGTTDATVTEHYDAEGRLVRVEEAAKNTKASATTGGIATTTYGYDVAGRLASVSMTDGTTTQGRTFSYDNRGFLTSETHPESGTTSYAEHDALGNALKVTAGNRVLRYAYDAAARVTSVEEHLTATNKKPLKSFEFATANSGLNLAKGKLYKAVRHNHLPSAGEIIVTETYEYATPTGQVSTRTTLVEQQVGSTKTSIQQFVLGPDEYHDFRLEKKIVMPSCSLNGCSSASGLADVTFSRTNGFLTSVPGFATVGYHASGMVKTVAHASVPAATDTYDSVKEIPRPSTITFSGGQACPDLAGSSISAPGSVCPNSQGNIASVSPRAGITHTWHITGGAITSATTGESITFTAGASGHIVLTVKATDECGGAVTSDRAVAIFAAPTATITSVQPGLRIPRNTTASIAVALSGNAPWTITWSDGVTESNLSSASHVRHVTPPVTTTYTITSLIAGSCTNNSPGASTTITAVPPAPTTVMATTSGDRTVSVTWPAVSGASQYQIERTTALGGSTTWSVTVAGTQTSYSDLAPATAHTVAYVYYVRTIDSANTMSDRGARDYAVAASQLYSEPQLGGALIKASQIVELRRGIDALRVAGNLAPVFSGQAPPTGLNRLSEWSALVAALDPALGRFDRPAFFYVGVAPPDIGVLIRAAHIQQLRDALK